MGSFRAIEMIPDAKAILFDLDGTLLDCHQIHYQAFHATFLKLGIKLSRHLYRRVYCPNWYRSYAALGLPPQIWRRLDRLWLEEMSLYEVQPFPGTVEVLTQLRRRYRLGLVTAGTGSRVRRDLERSGLDRFFEVVITNDDVERVKPHPEGLDRALKAMGLPSHSAIYVGDSEVDFEMARGLGVAFIGVASPVSRFRPSPEAPRIGIVTDLADLLVV